MQIRGIEIIADVKEMQQYAQRTHEQVLDLIASLSDSGSSDQASSVCIWDGYSRAH
jgi:hypothetical protein